MATHAQRQHMLGVMDMLLKYEPLIGYLQRRPMASLHLTEGSLLHLFQHRQKISMDCSESVTLICKFAGLRSPVFDYGGYGNTQTMLNNNLMRHYDNPAAADVGALVVFGPHADASRQHVCMVHAPDKDPWLWSHGQERGPLLIRLSDERKYHAPPVTFLSITNL